MVLNAKVVFPVSKNTSQAFFGLSVTDVADQYTSINTLVKGCPAGRVGPDRVEGSTKLASSEIDGNLQPFRPPTFLSAQTARASVQDISVVSTVFSQDRKSTRLNSSHSQISYAVFCLKKKT